MTAQTLTLSHLRHELKSYANERLPQHWLDGWILHCLSKSGITASPILFITEPQLAIDADVYEAVMAGVAQMADGVPVAYLTGQQGFWGREFLVNHATLIPRADTEKLIEVVLAWANTHQSSAPSILDLGTGTGCIGITLALELPDSQVCLVDFSKEALMIAKKNIKNLNAANVSLLHSSWYNALSLDSQFDIIVSNPPYIDASDDHLQALTAEPISALVAGEAGLADIRKIIDGAKTRLKAGGLLAIEHGYDQGQAVSALFNQAGFGDVAVIQDYGNNDRLTIGVAT